MTDRSPSESHTNQDTTLDMAIHLYCEDHQTDLAMCGKDVSRVPESLEDTVNDEDCCQMCIVVDDYCREQNICCPRSGSRSA